MRTEESATEAHAMGRHQSTHPEDKVFWAKTCPVCKVSSRLQPWMVRMAQGWAARLNDEQLQSWAHLPIDGMTPGDMLNKIVAQQELENRQAGQ